jgi:hypothetical protein
MPVVAYLLGVTTLFLAIQKRVYAGRIVCGILAFFAATNLGIKEDFGLLAAGVIATMMILMRGNKRWPVMSS